MEAIIEIAGLAVKLVSEAGGFLSAVDLARGAADSAPAMEIVVETEREVHAGQGLEVNCRPGGVLEFSMSGVACRLAPSEGKGRLIIVADGSVFEYALKIIFSTILLARGGGIFHAAGLGYKGESYLFAGPHGAGKSTIAKAAPGGAEVLGDENVVVRKGNDGRYWIHAMPGWALGGAGDARSAGARRKAPLAACFILSYGGGSREGRIEELIDDSEPNISFSRPDHKFESRTSAERAHSLFENMIYLLPEKAILESAMKFADELQQVAPTAGLQYSLDKMENFWDAVAGYLGKKYKRAPDCAFREIEGEVFIVSSKTAGVHLLNSVGSYIWNLLDGEKTLGEIVEAVTNEFDVDSAEARRDTSEFVGQILKTGIIQESP